MTKRERKALQEFMNKTCRYDADSDKVFKELQDLNQRMGTGHRWCSAEMNYKDLLSCGHDYGYLFKMYVALNAKKDLLKEYGSMLAELNFWNRKGDAI